MRTPTSLLFVAVWVQAFTASAVAQISLPLAADERAEEQRHAVPGSHLLWRQEQEVRRYVARHPEMVEQMRLARAAAWGFVVGSQKSWYAHDFTASQNYLVPSTCRAVGSNCYVFVENTIWGTRVTQAIADSVRIAFDLRTPANSTKGIYQMNVDAFGNPPDVDSDRRIIILLLNIKDGWDGSGGYVAGYFYSLNETTLPESNRAEIYFLDANPTNLASAGGLRGAMSTTAHEFQHMIQWNYDQDEYVFVKEGCALIAEVNCGYPIFEPSGYVNETNRSLFSWRNIDDPNVTRDYSRAARFMTYLRDQVGIGLFRSIVQTQLDGIDGLNAAMQTYGTTLRFDDIFKNWVVANILDDRSANPAYGYVYRNLPKVAGRLYINPNVSVGNTTIQNLAVEYVTFKGGSQVRATFATDSPGILIKAVEIGLSANRVLDVPPNLEFSEPDFGTTYKEIHFVVLNADRYAFHDYSLEASGIGTAVVELKWDETEPVGYLPLSNADTVCVAFDAVAGARLDSIRIGLRRAGAITGGVWRYTGVIRPTPLGARLAVPISASVETTPPYPYPVPWPNWGTVDLRAHGITADQPFAVAFVVGSDPHTPGAMVATYPSQSPYHSFTYLHNPGSGLPNWYYLVSGETDIYVYLIRAYVSFGTVGVPEVAAIAPLAFLLEQNYPNPFNPSTTIHFSLPSSGFATLKVFNVAGEEVTTLLSDEFRAGRHKADWNAARLPSGVYFYRLQLSPGSGAAGQIFTETRKLLLLK